LGTQAGVLARVFVGVFVGVPENMIVGSSDASTMDGFKEENTEGVPLWRAIVGSIDMFSWVVGDDDASPNAVLGMLGMAEELSEDVILGRVEGVSRGGTILGAMLLLLLLLLLLGKLDGTRLEDGDREGTSVLVRNAVPVGEGVCKEGRREGRWLVAAFCVGVVVIGKDVDTMCTLALGLALGIRLGDIDGTIVGEWLAVALGEEVGMWLGDMVGMWLGDMVGRLLGFIVGSKVL
jgi:hypothetical protein